MTDQRLTTEGRWGRQARPSARWGWVLVFLTRLAAADRQTGVFRPTFDISRPLCDIHGQVKHAHVFFMKPPVCICCGEAISPAGNVALRNPNMCASCSSLEDGNAGPVPSQEEPALETLEDIAKLLG